MRWSKTFIPTIKEVPQEAEIQSHKLMLRAGLIRRLSAGLYTYMPTGLRALRNLERIIREEMDAAGAVELLMPALQPAELWERSGRLKLMSGTMFHLNDRQGREMVLGPTHEEVITNLVAREISSYRQLPINFYQIQTKFRDEIRSRFGLMRCKEFIMKDAYSFDLDLERATASYEAMYNACKRIFAHCGLKVKIVEADTGSMGGQSSHEFMVLADSGEDGIVECADCEYAANLEKAEAGETEPMVFADCGKELEPVSTPDRRAIAEVSEFLDVEPQQLIKTLIYLIDGMPCAVLVPGDREVNELKLARMPGVGTLELADDETVESATGAPVGFAGPAGLDIPIYADKTLRGCKGAITGANKANTHLLHVDLERDADVKEFGDIIFIGAGDKCPRCGGVLDEKRGIEVGHVFKLGTKYSKALNAVFLDSDDKEVNPVMGCYGLGISRTLQALIEQNYDENGIIWPMSVAPFQVEVVVINARHAESMSVAERIMELLEDEGMTVLLDDRDERPGFKFKDADLLGVPLRINVGERGLKSGTVDMRERASGETGDVAVEDVVAAVKKFIKEHK